MELPIENNLKHKMVLGFAFSEDSKHVLLIRKNRPFWMQNLLNGVGGQIHEGESTFQAMRRECKEEAGVDISENRWTRYCHLRGPDWVVACHHARVPDKELFSARMLTDEQIMIANREFLIPTECIHNLLWLLAMALDPQIRYPLVVSYPSLYEHQER